MKRHVLSIACTAASLAFGGGTRAMPFADGDRVAFFGDSITRNGEAVTRTAAHYRRAFPERKVRFFNVGVSGGSAIAANVFFEKWIAPLRPTHVVLAFGVNDAGEVVVADDARRKEADEAVARFELEYGRLIDRIEAVGAKVMLRTPTPYDESASGHGGDGGGRVAVRPGRGSAHRRIAECIRRIAKRRSLPLVDDLASFEALLAAGESLFGRDRVHPNGRGQWRLADDFLKAQGLTAGEYRPFAEVAGEVGLAAWHETATLLTNIPSAEWLIVRDEGLSVEEKIAKVGKWLADNEEKDGVHPVIVRFAREYLCNKPRESELRAEEETAFTAGR